MDADVKAQLLREVGDPKTTIHAFVEVVWGLNTSVGYVAPTLQYLYTKRTLIDMRLAEEQPNVDAVLAGELTITRSPLFTRLETMKTDTVAEIVRIEGQLAASRPGAVGALSRTEIDAPASSQAADANDSLYSGSPYKTLRRSLIP